MIPYQDADNGLRPLLKKYAPSIYARKPNTKEPFWRLKNDGFWELDTAGYEDPRRKTPPAKKDLLNMRGGLIREDYQLFSNNPNIAISFAQEILNLRFPCSLHQEILETAGIEPFFSIVDYSEPDTIDKFQWIRRRWRDPKFSKEVIHAYKNQCAVCRFSVRMDDRPIGLEAAHIMWHQYHGPAKISNGLALCATHHKLFDAGAFTITPDSFRVSVSDQFFGHGDDEILGRYDSATLSILPSLNHDYPNHQYLKWHIDHVFRGTHQV